MEMVHPNDESIKAEMAGILNEQQEAIMLASNPELAIQKNRFKLRHLFFRKEQRMALIISSALMICQMWSGINAIFAYSHSILTSAGVPENSVQYAIVGTGVINILVTGGSIVLIERTGRRNLTLWPTLLMCACMGVLVVTIHIQKSVPWCSYISVCMLFTYIIGFGLGLGPIPTIVPNELFHQDPRPTAVSIANAVQWISNFIVTLSFKFIESACGEFMFFFYIAVTLLSLGVVAMWLPETANREINTIVTDLRGGWRWTPCTDKPTVSEIDDKCVPLTSDFISQTENKAIARRKSAFV